MTEKDFIKLRYCFQAGYTLPQFCVDNGIKKPLFVLEQTSKLFLLEVCAQFKCDGRLPVNFCFLDGDKKPVKVSFGLRILGSSIAVKNISNINLKSFDTIIFLTNKNYDTGDVKTISFKQLVNFFVQRAYVDIPLLNFLQRYPKVKIFLTNFPNKIKRYRGGVEFDSQLWSSAKLKKAINISIKKATKRANRIATLRANQKAAKEIARNLAMQAVGMVAQYLNEAAVPTEIIEREKEICDFADGCGLIIRLSYRLRRLCGQIQRRRTEVYQQYCRSDYNEF